MYFTVSKSSDISFFEIHHAYAEYDIFSEEVYFP
jgi:hypothetical protein